jgi:quercetin dioxygenase-like cupin family protein
VENRLLRLYLSFPRRQREDYVNTTFTRSSQERFAGTEHALDLTTAFIELEAEAHETRDGHRQITVFHRENVTLVAFAFEDGGQMREHSAKGLVTIQVLSGHIEVQTASQNHNLMPGQLVIMQPNIQHSVLSHGKSRMLLTSI